MRVAELMWKKDSAVTTVSTRWALIGTGGMALNIIRDFGLAENVELTTVVSRSPEKGAAFAAEWGVPNIVTDYDELWASPDIDVVYIATPHPSHHGQAKAAIAAGKHVLVEKPITMTVAEAVELRDLAGATGVFLMEAMWTRFNPVVRKVQELVAAGAVGDPRVAFASFGIPVPFDPESRLWNADLGGGSMLDQGVYPITWAHLMFGAPSSISARGTMTPTGVDTQATILLGYPNGQEAILNCSMTTFLPLTASISGTAGQITLDPPFWGTTGYKVMQLDLAKRSLGDEHVDVPTEGRGYVPMLRAVSQAILDGRREHPLCTLSDTIAVMEVVEEVLGQLKASRGAG